MFAKHYLTAELAGQYALLMLAGKMVFFIGSFVTPFIIPLVSKNEGEGKDSHRILYNTSFITLALVAFATGAFGVFGSTTIPFLFGSRALVITPYIFLVCLSDVYKRQHNECMYNKLSAVHLWPIVYHKTG